MSKRSRDDDDDDETVNQASTNLPIEDSTTDNSKRIELERQYRREDHIEPVIQCTLPPLCNTKPRDFFDLDKFQTHYQKFHTNICHECSANFPTNHFMDLHIEEIHDPIFQSRLTRGEKVYRCLVEYCSDRFGSSTSRRRHLEKVHQYPTEFRFNIVQKGLGKNTQSLLFPAKDVVYKQKSVEPHITSHDPVQMTGVVAEGYQAPLTRAQRRAQARQLDGTDAARLEAPKNDNGQVQSAAASPKTSKDKSSKSNVVQAKKEHAQAVRALFQDLVDPDTLEPEHMKEEDTEMDDLAGVMSGTKLVPDRIRFGHRNR